MAGADETNSPAAEVLEQGSQDRGRLETLSRSRGVRLAASGVLAAAAVAWALGGSGVSGLSSARGPGGQLPTSGSGDASASRVVAPSETEHKCQDEMDRDLRVAYNRGGASGDADTQSRAIATSLYRFARNPARTTKVPWARDVALTAPGAWTVVSRGRAATRQAWTSVSGRTGHYLLADLAASKGRYRVDDTVHIDCRSRLRDAKARTTHATWISVQARASAPCRSWWAVDVFLDERGRVARVTARTT